MSTQIERILVAEPKDFSKEAIGLLNGVGNVTCKALDQAEMKSALSEYDVVWIRLGLTIRQDDIPAYPRCRYVITATTGLNHLDLGALQHVGIEILSLKRQIAFLETVSATAEHTVGLLLSLVRKVPAAHQSVMSGIWNRDLFKGNEIAGKKIGIVGYGRLGKIVASYCRAFRMDMMVYDPFLKVKDDSLAQVDSLEELFVTADYVTLHVPLNSSTTGLIGKNLLSLMKPTAFLINTSRGEILDEHDLLEALKDRVIAGAALDVLCHEEFFSENNGLVQFARVNDNLILTPHIGGCTWESMAKCEVYMANILIREIRSLLSHK